MKITGIGDLFIPASAIDAGLGELRRMGHEVRVIDWPVHRFDELQQINHLIEKGGSEAYDPPAAVYEACRDADIIVTQFCPVPAKLMDSCPRLRLIGVLRAGVENVNTDYAARLGIPVMNTPGRNADSVADFTIGLIICECRNIARGHAALKQGEWVREYPNSDTIPDLPGKTVGIIGLGEIGRKVAKRLTGFDVHMLGYDPYVDQPPYGILMSTLPELMARSDFITVHVRHTPQTEKLVNGELIALMKPTAYLINTSRSAVVDENALVRALGEGRIAGAALDVFNTEPPGVDSPVIRAANITVTPHMAGGSRDAFLNSPYKLGAELIKWIKGREPRSIVNRDRLAPPAGPAAVAQKG